MAALRRRKIVAKLLKLTRAARRTSPPSTGPGCTCESCVQAWDRNYSAEMSVRHEIRRLRPGLG
jgi:hypothetical protein